MLDFLITDITDITDKLGDWASNWWFLGVIFAVALLDSMVPVVPSETAVIIGGVAVATHQAPYPLIAVIGAGAVGAFIGDNLAYTVGRKGAPWINRRAQRKPKFAKKLEWAESQIETRGGPLLITARFIPGGRTALTIASGITNQPRGWFIRWVAIATTLWAGYAAGLARLVGQPFADNHTAAFWVAFGAALSVTVIVELVRHVRANKHPTEPVTTSEQGRPKGSARPQPAGRRTHGTPPAD